MQVVEVIPIVRGLPKPTLTYFTKHKLALGSFVRVPLRKGSALGIVSATLDAKSAKSRLKDERFALKKLSSAPSSYGLSPAFLKAAEVTAKLYATTVGSVLGAVIPKVLLESPDLFPAKLRKKSPAHPREVKLVQLTTPERYREYRSIVRECFARRESVMLIVPSGEDIPAMAEALSAGIEPFVYAVREKSPKRLRKTLLEAMREKHPILFMTAPGLIAFDRPDFGTYILEKENSRAYRTLSRPYIHERTFLENLAKERGSTLILGDSFLSLESLWREKEGLYSEFTPLTWRLKVEAETEVVDMRAKKEFEILSPQLRDAIAGAIKRREKVFLFGARKGLSGTTICEDCSSLLLCKNCRSPLTLHDGPIYVCHHCGAKRSTETKCEYCGSWKLKPLGIGTELIVRELGRLFPDTPVLILDREHAGTKAQARAVGKEFNQSGDKMLVGTELALGHIEGASLVAAVSLDSLFSVPDFSINERIFYLITRLREMARDKFIIQTRNAGAETLAFAAAGNILDFYRAEIAEREELRYPPFSIFIKVTVEGTPDAIKAKAGELQKLFISEHPHFILKKGGVNETLSMILRFPRSAWPKREIVERLLLLTPDFMVKVDPESIL